MGESNDLQKGVGVARTSDAIVSGIGIVELLEYSLPGLVSPATSWVLARVDLTDFIKKGNRDLLTTTYGE